MADYTQVTDPRLQTRVRERYQREASALLRLGFRHLAFCLETLGPLSAVWQLPVLVLAAIHREVLAVRRPLKLASASLLLFHTDPPSVALCMGMGVKFYTSFSDGIVLISSDFASDARPRPGSRIARLPMAATLEGTWDAHRQRAREMTSDARSLPASVGFQDYIEMSVLEEDMGQYL